MIKNVTRLPVLASVFNLVTALSSHFLVVFCKINMYLLGKLRMELICHRYDVTNVDVFNVFYHTNMTSDMERNFPKC